MVELINKYTGGRMWVPEDRLQEYVREGHAEPARAAALPADKAKTARAAKKKTAPKKK